MRCLKLTAAQEGRHEPSCGVSGLGVPGRSNSFLLGYIDCTASRHRSLVCLSLKTRSNDGPSFDHSRHTMQAFAWRSRSSEACLGGEVGHETAGECWSDEVVRRSLDLDDIALGFNEGVVACKRQGKRIFDVSRSVTSRVSRSVSESPR